MSRLICRPKPFILNNTDVLYGFSILLKATFVKFYDCFIEERNAKRLN